MRPKFNSHQQMYLEPSNLKTTNEHCAECEKISQGPKKSPQNVTAVYGPRQLLF